MQSIVIDINEADAYVVMEDGNILNIDISKVPSGTKSGQKLNLNPALKGTINHRINQIIF